MARTVAWIVCLVSCLSFSDALDLRSNPIRKVVGMLQDMQKSVEAEGKKEQGLFDTFMCYCNNGASSLDNAIQTASSQIDSLTGKVETESAQKSQNEQDIKQHKTDREQAQATIKESTAMRQKEANEFAASSGEMKSNLEAMGGALEALKKGLSAALLQTSAGKTLRNILEHSPNVNEAERSTLLSFLESGEGGSDQIVGIVSQMKETMEADLKDTAASEGEAKASFTSLLASKEKEIAAAGKAVEEKTSRVGELAVSVVQSKADLEDTQEAMTDDQKFKANLAASCATKSQEMDERSKLRAQEIQAISETIEMLNGDDALELFKKSLPSPSAFLQLATATRAQRRQASTILRRLMARDPANAMNFHSILLSLKSRSGGGFDQVTKMIDGMIANQGKEQADEDKKRDFCIAEIAKTDDEEKALKKDVADVQADIDEKEDAVASLQSEIAAIQQGVNDLDKSVVEATAQRKNEHEEFTSTAASNQAALELIGMAKNRMNKFYAPSQYKAAPTTTETASPYGFVQIALHSKTQLRADPGPAPEMPSGEYKKSEGSGNVMSMMDQMIKDVEMDIQEGKHDEAEGQKDYEEAMRDAAKKRAADTKLMVEKQGAKADESTNLQSARSDRSAKREQLGLAQGKVDDLHIDCDNLLNNYDEIKKNRATEVDGLTQSKSVLQGATPR